MPSGIQAIVCAVDLSTFSPLVVAHGAALARRAGLHLYLFHAIHAPQDDLHPMARMEQGGDRGALRASAQGKMAALTDGLELDWTQALTFGDPVTQLSDLVDQLPPCLVVCASHGISGFRRLFIGTVVERLIRRLERPMLVIKPTEFGQDQVETGFQSILMGCDPHGHWRRAAALLPLLTGQTALLHLLHIMEDPFEAASRKADEQPYDEFQRRQQAKIQQALADSGRRLFPQTGGGQLSVEVAPGIPQELLLGAAVQRRADLLVVGVRASGKVGRWFAGSTTEAILRRSSCSVLTLPEPQGALQGKGSAP